MTLSSFGSRVARLTRSGRISGGTTEAWPTHEGRHSFLRGCRCPCLGVSASARPHLSGQDDLIPPDRCDPLLAKYTQTDRDGARRRQLPAACSSLTCTIRDGCYRERLQTRPALSERINSHWSSTLTGGGR